MGDRETLGKLVELALDGRTPEGEAAAAAFAACRLVRKLGVLEGASPERGSVTPSEVAGVRAPAVEVEADVHLGAAREDGWSWVRTGGPKFCFGCDKGRTGKRGAPVIIGKGQVAARKNGVYRHEECFRKRGG